MKTSATFFSLFSLLLLAACSSTPTDVVTSVDAAKPSATAPSAVEQNSAGMPVSGPVGDSTSTVSETRSSSSQSSDGSSQSSLGTTTTTTTTTIHSDSLLAQTYFLFDSSKVLPEAAADLKNIIDHTGDVVILGHCDERGTDEYNTRLGERRAHAVKEWLSQQGFKGQMAKVISLGKKYAFGQDTQGHACDRWVMVIKADAENDILARLEQRISAGETPVAVADAS